MDPRVLEGPVAVSGGPTAAPPDLVRVDLLGGFAVTVVADGAERPLGDRWRLRKAKSLVKLLALAPGHAVHRDLLAEALWPERPAAAAANNLHQAVHAARRAVQACGIDGAHLLGLRDDVVTLCPDVPLDVDVERFEAAAQHAQGTADPAAHRRALALYPGDLLPQDQYEDWALPRRASLRSRRRDLRVALAELLAAGGASAEAARLACEVLDAEPLHEPGCRLLMTLHAAAGRAQEALQLYGRLREGLAEATGADPDPLTRRLYRELLAGSAAEPGGAVGATRAPARQRGSRAHNLPTAATSYVDRPRPLADTGQLLDRVRLLTLTGPGGCGKTRLALQLAAQRVGRPRDGVWLVELSGLQDPDLVPQAVASALRVVLAGPDPAVQTLAAVLESWEALLVLDTCEHLVESCSAVAAELLRGCPGLRVLATSREPLRVAGEVCWRVPSLTVPDARTPLSPGALARYESVQLFTGRAQAVRPDFRLDAATAPAVATVCAGLDGIPLALELAAARVAHLSVPQIADRLDDAMALLGGGDRSALTRQQTLEATLAWSHELLTGPERVLLRRLSVFAGSPDLDAVEAVCADDGARQLVLPVLSRLVDKSLVLAEPSGSVVRYRLLDTVRQYAGRHLDDAGETEQVQRRHLCWFSRLAAELDVERAGPVVTSPSARLDLFHDDLRAALRSAVELDGPAALRLAVSLWRFWLARGHFGEGARWLDAALAAAPGTTPLHAAAWFAHAAFDVRRGDGTRLEQYGRAGLEIARQVGDPAEQAQSLHLHALLCWLRGAWDEAEHHAGQASTLAGRHRVLTVTACAAHVRGLVRLSRSDVEGGRAGLLEALHHVEKLVDEPRPFFSTATLGFAVEREATDVPVVLFEETVLLGRKVGAAQAAGYLLANLATAARMEGDTDEAARLLTEAEQRFGGLGDREGRALALNLHGALERTSGRHPAARSLLLESLRLRRAVGDRRGQAVSQGNLGVLLADAGQPARGAALLRRSGLSFAVMQDAPGAAATVLNRAAAAVLSGETAQAVGLLRTARELLNVPGTHRARAWTTLALAGASSGPEADVLREAAREQFTRLGELRGLARTAPAPRTGRAPLAG
jgi:predicted ATPase/DNA-binding SARP family transcriptional activator